MQWLRSAQFVVLGYNSFGHRGYRNRSRHFTPNVLEVNLKDRHYLVTGASSGLGRATAEALGSRGATVHLLVRSAERAAPVVDAINSSGGTARVHICDISSLKSVSDFSKTWNGHQLDALVNNAGVLINSAEKKSADGFEMNFATNTLGTYVLTEMLLPALEKTPGSRVVTVASGGMYTEPLVIDDMEGSDITKVGNDGANIKIDGTRQYARNKRQQIALTEHWSRRHKEAGIFWSVMHPGWADTPGVEQSMPEFYNALKGQFRTVEQGADTIVWLTAADEAKKNKDGTFFFDRASAHKHLFCANTSYPPERTDELATKLRDLAEKNGVVFPERRKN